MRKYIFALLVGSGVYAAPGKFTGGNALRVCMTMLRDNPAALIKLRKVARVFQNVMSYETKATGKEAVVLYGGKICVNFSAPSAKQLCDFLRQEKTQGWIKEISFKGGEIEVVKKILGLYNDSLNALRFDKCDFNNGDMVLPNALKTLCVKGDKNVSDSVYGQINQLNRLKTAYDSNFIGKSVVFPASLEVLDIRECEKIDPQLPLGEGITTGEKSSWRHAKMSRILESMPYLETVSVSGTPFPDDMQLKGI